MCFICNDRRDKWVNDVLLLFSRYIHVGVDNWLTRKYDLLDEGVALTAYIMND